MVIVTQDEAKPVEKKVLAQAIVDISTSMKKLTASGLNRKAIIILVAHSTTLPQRDIAAVFDSLDRLAKDYTK